MREPAAGQPARPAATDVKELDFFRPMQPALSIYLNLLRVSVAVVVLLGHAGTREFSGGLLWQFNSFGQDAVTVFFVLSGFVIGYATDRRETRLATYLLHRAARIYSVAIPALLLTAILDLLSCQTDFVPIGHACGHSVHDVALYIPVSLAFLNEIWGLKLDPGSNAPYWSLGFEVPYYLIFGVSHFVRRPWNWLGAGLLMVVCGPKIAMMFPVWLTGLGCYRLCKYLPTRGFDGAGLVLWMASAAGLAALCGQPEMLIFDLSASADSLRPWFHYVSVGLLVAANIVATHVLSERLLPLVSGFARPIGWFAGATFSIYLFHFPIMNFVAAVSPWDAGAVPTRVAVFLGVPLTTLLLAHYTERRKDAWRLAVVSVAGRLRKAVGA